MKCSVIVDGNRHIGVVRIVAEIVNGVITLDRCKQMVESIKTKWPNIELGQLEISLFDVDLLNENWEDLTVEEFEKRSRDFMNRKTAYYDVPASCLRIYQHGSPIYENLNGVICNDVEALADCLM